MHDVVQALNLLEALVKGQETRLDHTGLYYDVRPSITEDRYSLMGKVFHSLGVSNVLLEALGSTKVHELYEQDLSPVPLTLGAMLVYRSAQRTQDGLFGADRTWGAAFNSAVVVAVRVFDLIPDSVVAAAHVELVTA